MLTTSATDDVVTFRLGDQWFGIAVLDVQEVIGRQRIARVPLAAPSVAGLQNLPGQNETAIEQHQRLQKPPDTSET
jgi:purine-binding chemotaxis protein CheW